MKAFYRVVGSPLLASLLAIIIGAIVVGSMDYNPLVVYGSLISGAFGGLSNLGNTLAVATPLTLAGVAIAVAFKAGLFNIGADGQYWVGAAAAVWVGYHFMHLPGIVHILLCLLASIIAGGVWGGIIPGLTKAYVGAHEVITTMMLSYIGIDLVQYLVEGGPMQQPGQNPQSPVIASNTFLWTTSGTGQLSFGFIIALLVVVAIWLLLFKTTIGYQLRAVGLNQRASRYAGMNVTGYTILALTLSGILAGLAGGVQMLGQDHQLLDGFTSQYGYTAIVVSLLARNNPFGVIISAIFFAALQTGGQNMQIVSGVPASLTSVLTGLIIFFVATERLLPETIKWYRRRRPNRAKASA